MRVLIQRVSQASVTIGGREFSRIDAGLLLLVGIEDADSDEDIEWLAGKIARLRIFDDSEGVMNLDITQMRDDEYGYGRRQTDDDANRRSCGILGSEAPVCSASGSHHNPLRDSGGEVLAISQFTLHASTRRGNRPSYIRAARPEIAEPLYNKFTTRLSREIGKEVKTGVFGADMRVALVNDGPVTILIDSKNRE